MPGNVLSWGVALRKGFEPGLYEFTPEAVPLGMVEAVLDFKIWAKNVMGINCYFTDVATRKKFQLTVYLSNRLRLYRLGSGEIDFYDCPTERIYRIDTEVGKSGKIMFVNAILLQAIR